MTWKLQAITGEFAGQEINIDRDMLVGRHQDADILLQSAEISRRHAAFLLKEQGLWLQDLNSSNGTFVNEVRIQNETLLNSGDTIQFASLKFTVSAAASALDVPEIGIEPVVETTKTAAEQMADQGMPSLNERAAEVSVNRDGMPQRVAVPKPAPIPEGIDLNAKREPEPVAITEPVSRVAQEKEQQKNASIGLITIISLVILAVLAWLLLK
ncbi:FHA domain-containing protein [Acinetobacter sp. GSS19]|uniref:FHA domain-containing protein n=1 Tax=Acinetobacter sp. GSS19 TaxID=3020716 RepID=UPI00235E3ED7|nr:FHA domain-containing protein [Acinetobacter sp. GSS19]